jgi:hypothetical protein
MDKNTVDNLATAILESRWIRAQALNAAVATISSENIDGLDVDRVEVISTAKRYEDFIRNGE